MSDPELVRAAYKVLLGREPDGDAVVAELAAALPSPEDVLRHFVDERQKNGTAALDAMREQILAGLLARRASVDVEVSGADLERLFERVRTQWTTLGATEPYWSVLTNERYRMANIEQHRHEFETSGRHSLGVLDLAVERAQVVVPRGTCLELGCGVGRVTRYLAERFETVIGVDVSQGNLDVCRDHLARVGVANVDLRLLASPRDIEELPSFDALFTVIVLQHNPPPVIKYMLDVLLAKIRAGGIAFFQVPTGTPGYSFSLAAYLADKPAPLDMHALPMPDVLGAIARAGLALREVVLDNSTGMYGSHTFLALKPASG